MSTRIGIDLVPTASLAEKLAANAQFWAAFMTEAEWRRCHSTGRWLDRAAGRWAAKEAVVKVLRPSKESIDLRDIEVQAERGGCPRIALGGTAAAAAQAQGLTEWDVTISHSGGFAMAAVIATAAPPPRSDMHRSTDHELYEE